MSGGEFDDLDLDLAETLGEESVSPGRVVFEGRSFTCEYFNPYLEQNDVGISAPRLVCRTSDVAGIGDGSALTINGAAAAVIGPPQRDDGGVTTLAVHLL